MDNSKWDLKYVLEKEQMGPEVRKKKYCDMGIRGRSYIWDFEFV